MEFVFRVITWPICCIFNIIIIQSICGLRLFSALVKFAQWVCTLYCEETAWKEILLTWKCCTYMISAYEALSIYICEKYDIRFTYVSSPKVADIALHLCIYRAHCLWSFIWVICKRAQISYFITFLYSSS